MATARAFYQYLSHAFQYDRRTICVRSLPVQTLLAVKTISLFLFVVYLLAANKRPRPRRKGPHYVPAWVESLPSVVLGASIIKKAMKNP